MAYSHYAHQTASLIAGLKNKQIQINAKPDEPVFAATENASEFSMVKAHNFAKDLWREAGFVGAASKADLHKKLDTAIAGLQEAGHTVRFE